MLASRFVTDTNDKTIAYVWSFKNDMADIPYRIELRPGAQPRKVCNCPAFSFSGGRTCKHIRVLKEKINDGTIFTDEHYQITEYGKKLLKIA